jgi:hypothetical protein
MHTTAHRYNDLTDTTMQPKKKGACGRAAASKAKGGAIGTYDDEYMKEEEEDEEQDGGAPWRRQGPAAGDGGGDDGVVMAVARKANKLGYACFDEEQSTIYVNEMLGKSRRRGQEGARNGGRKESVSLNRTTPRISHSLAPPPHHTIPPPPPSEHRPPRDSPSAQASPRADFLPHRRPPSRRRRLLQALGLRRLGRPPPVSHQSRQGTYVYIASPPSFPPSPAPFIHSPYLPPSPPSPSREDRPAIGTFVGQSPSSVSVWKYASLRRPAVRKKKIGKAD